MPLAFPSHQGLILPLWRWLPRHVDGVALCVGAAMPDIVDGAAWPFRGELERWLGHSLLGVVAACVPAGLVLTWAARRCGPRALLARLEEGAPGPRGSLLRSGISVGVGALSHVVFDLVTHANSVVLWPWCRNDHVFPAWWYHAWGEVDLPVYREPYPLAPHTACWVALTILGAVLFVRCLRRPRAG